MRRTLAAVLCGAIIAACLTPLASAQQSSDEGEIITDVSPSDSACTMETAHRISLQNLARYPQRYVGQCVRTSGVIDGWSIFASVEALYSATDQDAHSDRPSRIGSYPQAAFESLAGNVVFGDVAGVAENCDTFAPSAMMFLGYCHHYGGAFLIISALEPGSPVVRRVGPTERRQIGTLGFAPANWEDRNTIERMASDWIASIENHDLAALARLSGRDLNEANLADENSDEHFMIAAVDSPFVEFRAPREHHQLALFVTKAPGEGRATLTRARRDREAYACICRIDDCTGVWPISVGDAWNEASHPYVCADIYNGSGDGEAAHWYVQSHRSWRTMREP